MSVTASKKNQNAFDSLEDCESELRYVWGPWVRRYDGDGFGLGFSKTNILHATHGLGDSSDPEMPADVRRIDQAILNLPDDTMTKINPPKGLLIKLAKAWWGYNGCVSKRALLHEMQRWCEKRGDTRRLRPEHIDRWIGLIVFCVWGQLSCQSDK